MRFPPVEELIKKSPPVVWNTGHLYTEHGQRIAAIKLPDDRVYFVDVDRNIDGSSKLPMSRMYLDIKDFVIHVYDFCEYDSGTFAFQRQTGYEWARGLEVTLKTLAQIAPSCKR